MEFLRTRAAETAELLKVLANENRILILCKLADGPCNVSQLNKSVPFLSQSAVSQHLAKLREAGIVCHEPKGASMVYSLADPRTKELLVSLRDLYCCDDETSSE